MPIITLVSKQSRDIPFWGSTVQYLIRRHGYIVRDIVLTLSTPGDLTCSQFPVSMLFTSSDLLTDDEIKRLGALVHRNRRTALVIEEMNRNWEHIQVQLVQLDLAAIMLIPVLSAVQASDSISSFICSYKDVPQYTYETQHSAELLRILPLKDVQLQMLFEQVHSLADLSTVFLGAQDDVEYWNGLLGEEIVPAIYWFFTQGD